MNRDRRHAVIARYVAAIRAAGDVVVAGRTVRDALRDGATDLWSAGELRESSPWRDPSQFDQVAAMLGREATPTPQSTGRAGPLVRAVAAWARSFVHALPRRASRPLDAEVVFVEYWPTGSKVDPERPAGWASPYFGSLPDDLRSAGIAVGFVHLHADGPVTRPPRGVRGRLALLERAGVPHRLLADQHGLSAWWTALRAWARLIRRAPRAARIASALSGDPDARRLWGWWGAKYAKSTFGSHAVRSCLLGEFFRRTVKGSPRTRLWIVAFEGQSWESCLARQLDAAGATWLPYVHTMMRPWDLRAHTFLAEHAPRRLAVHGAHDRDELSGYGSELVEVEALRYQHLGERVVRDAATSSRGEPTWLVVGGAECDNSVRELRSLLAALAEKGVRRRIVVKWHPQCGAPPADGTFETTDRPLREAFARADAVMLVGSAAPLDAYLAGIPSCSFASPTGLATTPLEDDDYFRAASDAADAVSWLASAEARRNERPPVDRYFVIDPRLTRWRRVVEGMIGGYASPR